MSRRRHARQVNLAEVGEDGQARVEATTARIDDRGLAGVTEARYLAGAGVHAIATGEEAVAEAARAVNASVEIVGVGVEERARKTAEPPHFGIKDPAALEVAVGAWRALIHLRSALGIGGSPPER